MQALCKTALGSGHVELRDVPKPVPSPNEVLIRVKAAGICGSDLHIYDGEAPATLIPPVVMGHELAGVVEETGRDARGFRAGDRVTAEPTYSACGHCPYCRDGFYNLCGERRVLGYAADGAFAEYIKVPCASVHRLPDNVDFVPGSLSEPLACCVHGLLEGVGAAADELAVVIGPGAIGLIALQVLRSAGARVIVAGTAEDGERLSLARSLGAEATVDINREDVRQAVREAGDGAGADLVVECAGAEQAAELGLDLARKRGRYLQMGLFGGPIRLDFSKVALKELRVTGSFAQKRSAWLTALDLMARGRVRLAPLATDILPLAMWEEGFQKFREKKGVKIVLTT